MNTPNPQSSPAGTNTPNPLQDPSPNGNGITSFPSEQQLSDTPDLNTAPIDPVSIPTATPNEQYPYQQSEPVQPTSVEPQPTQPNTLQSSDYTQNTNTPVSYAPQNITPEVNTTGTLNTAINNPVQSESIQSPVTTTEANAKNGLPKILKIILLVVIVFIFLGTLSVVVFGAKYLKENHIPLVSGLTETILLSEGEQFSTRVEYLFDLGMYKTLTMENSPLKPDFDPQEIKPIGADKIIDEVETAEQINYDTSLKLKYTLAEPLPPVLGIKDPGEITADSISKILSSKEGSISFSSQDSIQFNNQDRARNITNMELDVPGVNLNTGFEMRIIDKLIYFNLDRFPRNDYLEVEDIEGQWLMLDPETLAREAGIEANVYDPEELINEFTSDDQTELKKVDYDKMIQLINSTAVQNSITRSFEEKVSETNARCYVMSLTKDNVFNIYKEAGKLFDNNYDEENYKEMRDEDYPFKKADLTLCFAKLESYPVKVAFDFEFEEYENTVEGLFEFKMTGMKMVTPVEKPADARTFTLKDLEGLVKQPNYITEPSLREIELEDDLYDDYSSQDFYTRENVCDYLGYYNVCDLCTNDSPDCQVCLDSYNDSFDSGTVMTIDMQEKCL